MKTLPQLLKLRYVWLVFTLHKQGDIPILKFNKWLQISAERSLVASGQIEPYTIQWVAAF